MKEFKVKCINNIVWESHITIGNEYTAVGFNRVNVLLKKTDDGLMDLWISKDCFELVEQQEKSMKKELINVAILIFGILGLLGGDSLDNWLKWNFGWWEYWISATILLIPIYITVRLWVFNNTRETRDK